MQVLVSISRFQCTFFLSLTMSKKWKMRWELNWQIWEYSNTEAKLCLATLNANWILANKPNKYNYFKGVTVLQKLLIKQLSINLINSVLINFYASVRSTNIDTAIIDHSLDILNENTDSAATMALWQSMRLRRHRSMFEPRPTHFHWSHQRACISRRRIGKIQVCYHSSVRKRT